jgi:hypothetical protein
MNSKREVLYELQKYKYGTMSNMARRHAIAAAWEWEAYLVSHGYCTRKWSVKEQRELLKTGHIQKYEGHHMKNAAKHPEWANAPENIQFLQGSRYTGSGACEHSDVHRLNADGSTNGYYDVEDSVMIPFGNKPPTRRVFKLEQTYIKDESQIEHYFNMRTAGKKMVEDLIRARGIAHAFTQHPKSPVAVAHIIALKEKAEVEVWELEAELVKKGKGSRQWTLDEQEELLSYGTIVDYEPHHLASSFLRPQYAGNVQNVQLLTSSEHLKAHKGNWMHSSNGYFNPETSKIEPFGDNPPKRIEVKLNERFVDTPKYWLFFGNTDAIERMITNTEGTTATQQRHVNMD